MKKEKTQKENTTRSSLLFPLFFQSDFWISTRPFSAVFFVFPHCPHSFRFRKDVSPRRFRLCTPAFRRRCVQHRHLVSEEWCFFQGPEPLNFLSFLRSEPAPTSFVPLTRHRPLPALRWLRAPSRQSPSNPRPRFLQPKR